MQNFLELVQHKDQIAMFTRIQLVNQNYTLSIIQVHMYSVFWQNSSFTLTSSRYNSRIFPH